MPSQTATILVTDLVGSTELRARLGEEDADELHRLHDRLVRHAVEAHGGVVVKGLGDGVLASFAGAAGAVAAAVAVQQAADSHTRQHPDHPLVLRVGMSAGDVAVERDGDHVGTPVVEAARLCAAARGGQILAADLVRVLTRGRRGHEFTVVGERQLKGLPDPVAVVEIRWERAPSGGLPSGSGTTAGGGGFVGRQRDLAELDSVLEAAVTGRGQLVLVPGEAGIGKTRLAEVAADGARQDGLEVAWAGCTQADVAPAFWPWTQLLRALLSLWPELVDRGAPGRLGRLLPELAGAMEAGPDPDPELARQELFDAVASLVRTAAGRRPLLLVVDDLHWADAPSVRLLAFVAPLLRTIPAVLLGTYRDIDVPPGTPFGEALADLVRHGRELALSGFTPAEVAEFVASLTGAEPSAEAAGALHRHTGGNPLFTRELVRLLSPSGTPASFEEETLAPTVPEGVRGILRRRLSGLSDECREVLRAGAAVGQEFAVDLVAGATGRPMEEVLERLDEALGARVVHDVGPGRCAFSHALIQGAVYEELGLARRVRLHQQVGDALEARRDRGMTVDPADLARHFLLAAPGGGAGKALRYTREAADRAMAALAYEDAADLYEQALAVLELDPTGADRAELLLGLGDARVATGDLPGAREAYAGVAPLARAAGRPDQLAQAALGMGSGPTGFEVSLFDREQIDLLEEALAGLGEASALRAWVMARLSVALSHSAGVERRLALSEEAVAMAREVGDDATLAYSLAAHCDAVAGPAYGGRRLDESTEMVALALRLGDRRMELLGRRLRLVAQLEIGQTGPAEAEVDAFASVAEALLQPLYLWYVPLWRGLQALMRGRVAESAQHNARAAAIGERAHSDNAVMLVGSQRWAILREQGRFDEALTLMEGLMAHVGELGIVGWNALALALAEAGRRAEALALLDRAAAGDWGRRRRAASGCRCWPSSPTWSPPWEATRSPPWPTSWSSPTAP